ncbi:PAS domain S-box protein [Marilutibacter alkalisoli]|uniref:histidine kinase n=1 Tax=Marilutibacter alkalisoli TaxID=2591633 RepID=A0A514BNS5_9GAMM|nr:PAS domain S-box protein [Lysobacter alkalisoli]QDH69033.1 PAS domain S-box protein [Lysobacter alkalisoli]
MFPQLFEMVPDALVVVDQDGRILLANRQAERLFGYPSGGLTGLPVETLMPEASRQRHRSHRNAYMQAPRMRPMGGSGMTLTGQRRSGEPFPVEIALSPLESDEGLRYLASVRDISETQRARQALVRARYDALVARIGQQALASIDDPYVIDRLPALLAETLAVDTVAVLFLRGEGGIEVGAAAGLGPAATGISEDREAWRRIVEGRPMIIEDLADDPGALPLVEDKGSGVIVPLLDRGRPMGALMAWSCDAGHFDHDALHLLQSVANIVAALVQRRRSEEQLAHVQRLDAIGQLTGGIAHDFNNLLTVMSGNLQLLEMHCEGDAEATRFIGTALRAVGRGSELTGKLLAFARRQQLNPCAIEPARLLHELDDMLRRTLGDGIRVRIECAEGLPSVYADPTQLDVALLNLALNARDAMPEGGEIAISAGQRAGIPGQAVTGPGAGHHIVFTVADTGHGMSAETLARAVEPFYTTKPTGRGSGLGLSMVYGFVEQSGGSMRLDSRPGRGTRVELYLPSAIPGGEVDPSPLAPGTVAGEGETVLVVEDEPAVRDIAAAFVGSLGYRVLAVGNAGEALEQLARDPQISLLFSDVMLGPGMNGRALAEAARRRRPELAVLLTSGHADAAAEAGAEAFELLRKPYRREDLAEALRRSLDGVRS